MTLTVVMVLQAILDLYSPFSHVRHLEDHQGPGAAVHHVSGRT